MPGFRDQHCNKPSPLKGLVSILRLLDWSCDDDIVAKTVMPGKAHNQNLPMESSQRAWQQSRSTKGGWLLANECTMSRCSESRLKKASQVHRIVALRQEEVKDGLVVSLKVKMREMK